MRCGAVIVITVHSQSDPGGNEELDVCEKGLRVKYTARVKEGMLYASDVITDQQMEKAGFSAAVLTETEKIADRLRKLSTEWLSDRSKPGIGLYLQCHGTRMDTVPSITLFAKSLLHMYETGFAFRKINLAACFSGGTHQELIDETVLGKFCAALQGSMSKRSYLDRLCVAGYRAYVTIRPEGFNSFDSVPRYNRTHPTQPLSDRVIQQACAISKIGTATKENLVAREQAAQKAENPPFGKDIQSQKESIQRYILSKRVRRFNATTGQWESISLMDYTDNADLREMIRFGEHIAAAKAWKKFSADGQPMPTLIPVTL